MKTPLIALALLLTLGLGVAYAQSGGYDLGWWTADGGGGRFQSATYTLQGTVGQPDASHALSSSSYTLLGGFWSGASSGHKVYLPLVVRDAP